MKKEIAEKWVAALRSGEYKQVKSTLFDGEGYCCLGVLCKVMGRNFVRNNNYNPKSYIVDGTSSSWMLPPEVKAFAGMRTINGDLNERDSKTYEDLTLIHLNDGGESFDHIADVIEQKWEIL